MFRLLGKEVSRAWPLCLIFWIAIPVSLSRFAPAWEDVARGSQFENLPPEAPSKVAQQLFERAFPKELTASTVVVVLCREDEPLREADKLFAERSIRNGLLQLAKEEGGLSAPQDDEAKRVTLRPELVPKSNVPEHKSIIARVRDYYDPGSGPFLMSGDQKATLVVAELTTEVLDRRAWSTIESIEQMLKRLANESKVPDGLQVALTGSAVVGRELRQVEMASVHDVEKWTVILVVILLLIIYRAPILALIPILTVFVAVAISVQVLAIMAEHGLVVVSETTRMYIIVVAYGAGVDYCLFLTARYREELLHGRSPRDATANALQNVGGAVVASAGTVACGIGMLWFAKFGKYHQAGFSIPFSLVVVLISALTFAPALLRMTGRWAFWPERLRVMPPNADPKAEFPVESDFSHKTWTMVSRVLLRRPLFVWVVCVATMAPFAVIAVSVYNQWDYGLAGEIPHDAQSRVGSEIVKRHFNPGVTGPIVVVLHNDAVDFANDDGVATIAELTTRIIERKEKLRLRDLRSVDQPFGISEATAYKRHTLDRESAELPQLKNIIRRRAIEHYVSASPEMNRHAIRVELVLDQDPLSKSSIDDLAEVGQVLREQLPPKLRNSEIGFIGPTASLRDLADVTSADLRHIEILVPAVVFVILVLLLWWPIVSLYLIASVIFSFLATLGVAHVFFKWLDPAGYGGLDWKVPIFLFTILVAVGEDYNIFLITRVKEERAKRGPIEGISHALVTTGGIISSCGIIMAGTFAALLAGSLVEMKQLGFALAFGVLLDTLVVRPLLVPAFLIVRQRFANLFTRRA
ncbi:MAG: MMPL family transporter [Gemmataceae bacterium]